MKNKSKLKTIIKAFSGYKDVSDEVHTRRLEICLNCPFNSKNVELSQLNLLSRIRASITPEKTFCTLCGCQVFEKTAQATEQCAKYLIGEEPLWNKLKIETNNSDMLNLVNLSPDKVTVDLIDNTDKFEVTYNKKLVLNSDSEIKLSIENDNPFEIEYVRSQCSCTTTTPKKINETSYELESSLNLNNLNYGNFSKEIYIGYKIDNKKYKTTIKLNGRK